MAMQRGRGDPRKTQRGWNRKAVPLKYGTNSLTLYFGKMFTVYKGLSHIESSQKVSEAGVIPPVNV